MTRQFERALSLYQLPLFDLLHRAHRVHIRWHKTADIQRCVLLSIKTGGCPEDCGYCSQSAHHDTGVKRQPLLSLDEVNIAARHAKEQNASRFCIGAAWRSAPTGEQFDRVLEMVRMVKSHGLEACATLGMLTEEQAQRLNDAGLDAYNHNLDTSREFYGQIITTRSFEDRLRTLKAARSAGLSLCCGGILGLGESERDRCRLIATLAGMRPQPESVPINILVPVPGTPLESAKPVGSMELIRTVAAARILMPRSRVRLSAGRRTLTMEAQVLAFFAGANSIFVGDRLLTTPNVSEADDLRLLQEVGA